LFVAERSHSYVCYCLFWYRLCDDEGDTAQEKWQRFLPPLSEDVWRGMTYC